MGHVAHGVNDLFTESFEAFTGETYHEGDHWHDADKNQGQLPVGPEEIAKNSKYAKTFPHNDFNRIGCSAGNTTDIKGDPRDQMARIIVIIKTVGKR